MLKKLILFPFGGNSREALLTVLSINARKKAWDIIGFIDDNPLTHGKNCLGIKVLGGREVLKKFPCAGVLAVPGNPSSFLKRKEIIENLKLAKDRFATIIDPTVVLSPDAEIGYNTLLMPNVVISCEVVIGNHCVILPNSVISHDSVVNDYCCVGSTVSISGKVTIGPMCYIGSGSKIREGICIKKRTLIGLGTNVVSDIEEGVVAVGNPARIIRKVTG